MKLNNKGFVISTLIYGVLILFILVFTVLVFAVSSSYNRQKVFSEAAFLDESQLLIKVENSGDLRSQSYKAINTGEYYVTKENSELLCEVNLNENDEIKTEQINSEYYIVKTGGDKLCKLKNYNGINKVIIDSYVFKGGINSIKAIDGSGSPSGENVGGGGDTGNDKKTLSEKLSEASCETNGNVSLEPLRTNDRMFGEYTAPFLQLTWQEDSKYDRYIIKGFKDKLFLVYNSPQKHKLVSPTAEQVYEVSVYGVTEANVIECIGVTESKTLQHISTNGKYKARVIGNLEFTSISGLTEEFTPGSTITFTAVNTSGGSINSITAIDTDDHVLTVTNSGNNYYVHTNANTKDVSISIDSSASVNNYSVTYKSNSKATYSSNPSEVRMGQNLVFTVNPVSGYQITNVEVKGKDTGETLCQFYSNGGTYTCLINQDAEVDVTTSVMTYKITFNVSGSKGVNSVPSNMTVNANTSFSFKARTIHNYNVTASGVSCTRGNAVLIDKGGTVILGVKVNSGNCSIKVSNTICEYEFTCSAGVSKDTTITLNFS